MAGCRCRRRGPCRMTTSASCERGSIRVRISGPRSGRRLLRGPWIRKWRRSSPPCGLAIARRSREVIAADPALATSKDAAGSTPLHHAAGFGTLDSLTFLIDKGADVNAKNRRGSTPLFWALHDESKVRLLVARGAAVCDQTGRRADSGLSGRGSRQWICGPAALAGERRRSQRRDAQWPDASQCRRRCAAMSRRCAF